MGDRHSRAQAQLSNAQVQLGLTVRMLKRQAVKAGKEEQAEKAKLEKEMKAGRSDTARIHAQNAIRKQTEKLNLMQLASRIDAVAGRVRTAVAMQTLSGNMEKVAKAMDVAAKSMNPERVSTIMEGFEQNMNNLDVVDEFTREATSSATAVGTPQEDVDRLMAQTADKVGVELQQDLQEATPAKTKVGYTEQAEDGLSERLRALRN